CRGVYPALIIKTVLHAGLWAWRIHTRGIGEPSTWSCRRTWRSGNSIPWPHGVRQVMTDRVAGITVKRCGDCRIETIKSSLPLRPKPIDISMKKKEKWISRGCRNARDETPEDVAANPCRVPSLGPKTGEPITNARRWRPSDTVAETVTAIKDGTTVD